MAKVLQDHPKKKRIINQIFSLNQEGETHEYIRKFIEQFKPEVAICGHIHENSGKIDYIGKTKVINPGYKGKIISL